MNGCNLLKDAEFYVAIDNKGLWPNLTLLPNGEIAAAVYNHPSHGYGSGSGVELWVSDDGGCSWNYRSTVTDNSADPKGIRMNHAVGLNAKGEIVAIVSGYKEGQKLPMPAPQCCISSDNGKTWERHDLSMQSVPFGNIIISDKELLCPMYGCEMKDGKKDKSTIFSFVAVSVDNGSTWKEKALVARGIGETLMLKCSDGTLLASGRTICVERMDSALPHGSGEKLYRSEDGGLTWDRGIMVSPQGQENAHLLELKDGRILYCFTSRIPGLFGVVFRISEDKGKSWNRPLPLITIPAADWTKTDAGYPSSVQLDDGTIVTAYYFGPKKPEYAGESTPWHQRYHMGVVRYLPDCL